MQLYRLFNMQDKIVQDSKYNKWDHVNNIVPLDTYSNIVPLSTTIY